MRPDVFDDVHVPSFVPRVHPDGRTWAARADREVVRLRLGDAEGTTVRRIKVKDPSARLAELLLDVEREGFAPWPPPRDALESWLAAWADQVPGIETHPLRDALLATPHGLAAIDAVLKLRAPLRALGSGSFEVLAELDRARSAEAHTWLDDHLEHAWPAMVLGLLGGSPTAFERLDDLLARHAREPAVPFLLALVGLDTQVPVRALAAHALPAYLDRFVPALSSDQFGVRLHAQHVLAMRAELPDVERCLFAHVPAQITEAEIEMFLRAAERSGNPQHANRLSVWGLRVTERSLARRLAEVARRLNESR